MDELIGNITQALGIDEATAKSALGIIMNYVKTEGPEAEVGQLLGALPGIDGLIEDSGAGSGGGMLGGPMAVMAQLSDVGVDMGQVSGIAQQLVAFAKDKVGDEAIDAIIAQVPGMDQLA